jgi:hypothetical protein
VHRLRNILARLPKQPELHERIKSAYWAALDEAIAPNDAEQRLRWMTKGGNTAEAWLRRARRRMRVMAG